MPLKLIGSLLQGKERKPSDKTFDILSISGVGALSIFGARILEHMEKEAEEPLARRFHLISGTSVGAVVALALAREYPAVDMVRLLRQRAFEIFNSGRKARAGRHRSIAHCDPEAWRQLLAACLGEDTRLKEVMHPVMVPTYDVTIGRPRLFGAPFALSGYGQMDLKLIDIATAASATPTLFPVAEIASHKLVDGVVVGPSPDLVILREAIHRLGAPIETIRIVSIGTLTGRFRLPKDRGLDMGLRAWSHEGQLQALSMAAQQQLNVDLMRDLLGDRYYHIDTMAPDEKGLPYPLSADRYVVERVLNSADSSWLNLVASNQPAFRSVLEMLKT